MLAAGGRRRAALSLFNHPAVSIAPPPSSAPFLAPSAASGGCGGRALHWDPRREPRVLSKFRALEARPQFPPSSRSCATPAAPAQLPPTRPHLGRSPAGLGAWAPRLSAAPSPAARGRGAAQAKLLSCSARSEVAAETAASRPLPGLSGSEHTPTRHRPLPALAPAARA